MSKNNKPSFNEEEEDTPLNHLLDMSYYLVYKIDDRKFADVVNVVRDKIISIDFTEISRRLDCDEALLFDHFINSISSASDAATWHMGTMSTTASSSKKRSLLH